MKTETKTTYICELCGRSYDIELSALKCENSHIKFNHGALSLPETLTLTVPGAPSVKYIREYRKISDPNELSQEDWDARHQLVVGSNSG